MGLSYLACVFFMSRCINQDLSIVVINLKRINYDLLFKNRTLFITFIPYKDIGLS